MKLIQEIQKPHSLFVTWDSGGTVTSHQEGTDFVLFALTTPGFSFNGWNGECALFGTQPVCRLSASQDRSAHANFLMNPKVTITIRITKGKGGVLIGGKDVCKSYPCRVKGVPLGWVLTPIPKNRFVFSGWNGGACSSDGIVLGAGKCQAVFRKK